MSAPRAQNKWSRLRIDTGRGSGQFKKEHCCHLGCPTPEFSIAKNVVRVVSDRVLAVSRKRKRVDPMAFGESVPDVPSDPRVLFSML